MTPLLRFTAAAVLSLTLVGGVLHLTGLQLHIVQTPSMGTTAPVGSLVMARQGQPEQGDLVVFRPAATAQTTYTHRVVGVRNGALVTKGDASPSADPWRITPDLVVGRVLAIAPGVGYLIKLIAYLAVALPLVFLVTKPIRRGRAQTRFLAVCVTIALFITWLRPLLNFVTIAERRVSGGATAEVAGTGILPLQFTSERGVAAVGYGQRQTVFTSAVDDQGRFLLAPTMHITGWWWLALIAYLGAPLLYVIVVGLGEDSRLHRRRPPGPPDDSASDPTHGPRHRGTPSRWRWRRFHAYAFALTTAACTVAVATTTPGSHAAFTAKTINTTNTAGVYAHGCRETILATTPQEDVYTLWDLGGDGVDHMHFSVADDSHTLTLSNVTFEANDQPCIRDVARIINTVNLTTSKPDVAVFNGVNSHAKDPTSTQFSTSEKWSIEFRFKTSVKQGKLAGTEIGDGLTETASYRSIYIGTDGHVRALIYKTASTSAATFQLDSGTDYTDNQWHHVVLVNDGVNMKSHLYVDGAHKSSQDTAAGLVGQQWHLGSGSIPTAADMRPANRYFKGKMAFVATYLGKALTAQEVLTHYKAQF